MLPGTLKTRCETLVSSSNREYRKFPLPNCLFVAKVSAVRPKTNIIIEEVNLSSSSPLKMFYEPVLPSGYYRVGG